MDLIKRQEQIPDTIKKLIHKYEFRRTFLLRKTVGVVSVCVVDAITGPKSEREEKFIQITLKVMKDYKGSVANKVSILSLSNSQLSENTNKLSKVGAQSMLC